MYVWKFQNRLYLTYYLTLPPYLALFTSAFAAPLYPTDWILAVPTYTSFRVVR